MISDRFRKFASCNKKQRAKADISSPKMRAILSQAKYFPEGCVNKGVLIRLSFQSLKTENRNTLISKWLTPKSENQNDVQSANSM
jgi:hypothetical protein